MKRAVIFGCGNIGKICYDKIKDIYDSLLVTDNNHILWGSKVNGVSVVAPKDILRDEELENIDLFIAVEDANVCEMILTQVREMGIKNIYLWKNPFFYSADKLSYFHKKEKHIVELNENKKSVLFISSTAGIRDHKIARMVKMQGWDIYLAYLCSSPSQIMPEYSEMYTKKFAVFSVVELLNLVKNNNFDIIHCSSEPEFVSMILANTNKIIVHDCHDLNSMTRTDMTPNSLAIEYLAHSSASGVIYPSEGLRKEGVRRFGIEEANTIVIENYIAEDMIPEKSLVKKSLKDKQIHVVYEGLLVSKPKHSKKFFETIWTKIADAGVHLHFYSSYDLKYCKYMESLHPNIHYEGNCTSRELAIELSQYDVGLCMFNDNLLTHKYLDNSSPLKLYEYLNAGIPVAVGNIESARNVVERYGVGRVLNLEEDILMQFVDISSIKIERNFLRENGLLLENKGHELIEFYLKLIDSNISGCQNISQESNS